MNADVDFIIDPKALGERLLERLDAMRRASPVYWSASNGAWLVTGHAEVEAGYSGRLPLSSRRLPGPAMVAIPEERRRALFPLVMQAPESWLLNMDDPGHARLRKLMASAFNRDLVERMRPHARRFITETLDRVGQYGGEPFDFVSEIAQRIPTRVILLLLGLPEALMGRMHYWSEVMNRVGNLHVTEQALAEVNDVLAEVAAAAPASARGLPVGARDGERGRRSPVRRRDVRDLHDHDHRRRTRHHHQYDGIGYRRAGPGQPCREAAARAA
jgi:cytochrome P450